MGNIAEVILLMVALFVGGAIMFFNLTYWLFGLSLEIGFNNIHGFTSGIFIILCKGVGLALMGLSAFVVYNIVKG